MTSGPGPQALRDADTLLAADHGRLLVAAAAGGAQVRSVAAAVAAAVAADRSAGWNRPRAAVVLGPTAAVDAAVLAAVLGPAATAPVVAAGQLPAWVGPLDLVVVLAGDLGDEPSARAAAAARRRGALTLVRAAADGPVADAAGPSLVPAELAVPEALAGPARWAVLAAAAARCGLGAPVDLELLADLLDAAAVAIAPRSESFLNPAANLAEHLSLGVGVLIGTDPSGDALAAHGAGVLMALAGAATAVLPADIALRGPRVLSDLGISRDLFADPFQDGASPPPRPVLISTVETGRFGPPEPGSMTSSTLQRMLPGAFHLDGAALAGPPDPDRPPGGPGRPAGTEAWSRVLTTGQVLDVAAAQLAVVAGVLLGPAELSGLGRSGGTRWAVREAVPESVRSGDDRTDDPW